MMRDEKVKRPFEYHEVMVVGAGPSGLSAAYYLKQRGIDYRVIERGSLLMTWRHERWDSFTLVTPNWMTRLPGMETAAPRNNAFMTLAEINRLMSAWVAHFEPVVLENVEAKRLRQLTTEEIAASELAQKGAGRARFEVETSCGIFRSRSVIVATGQYNQPFVPGVSLELPPEVHQMHSVAYKNPCQLKDGNVLVVGGGRSGVQIALELKHAGREVWLSLGTQRPIPDAYDNVNGVYWLNRLSGFAHQDHGVEYHPEDLERLEVIEKLRQTLGNCQSEGIELMGRLTGCWDGVLRFKPNLLETLKDAEVYLEKFRAEIEAHIERFGLPKPSAPVDLGLPRLKMGALNVIDALDLAETGIENVIWATGFRPNYRWVDVPVFKADGRLEHQMGRTSAEGLYFTGVELNPGFGGPSAYGIGFYSFGEDARRMVEIICEDLEDDAHE
jgi:putative flavoprotein involved in K+ transport